MEKTEELSELEQKSSQLSEKLPRGNTQGIYWHTIFSAKVRKEPIEEKEDDLLAGQLIDKLEELYKITLLEADFQLHGHMYNKTKKVPYVYLWNSKADAIGWHKEKKKYVIIDYKIVDFAKPFWEIGDAYGRFLHQCLVYARLLQLRLGLDYLPLILLVPISNNDVRYVHPGLFYDYPHECKNALNENFWSTTLPKPPLKVQAQMPFKSDINVGPVNEEMLLTDLFAAEAKVEDLIKALDLNSLVVLEPEKGVSVKRRVGTRCWAEFCFIVGFVWNFFRVLFRKCVSYVHVLNFNGVLGLVWAFFLLVFLWCFPPDNS